MDALTVALLAGALLTVLVPTLYVMERRHRATVAAHAVERHQLVRALRRGQYDLRSAQADASRLQASVGELHATLQTHLQENAELSERVCALEDEAAALKMRLNYTTQALADRDSIILLLKHQLDRAQRDLVDLKADLSENQHTLDDRNLALAETRGQLAEASNRANQLSVQLAAAQRALVEPEISIAQLKAQVNEHCNHADLLAQQLAMAERTLGERDELVLRLGSQLTTVSGETQQLAKKVLAAERTIAERDAALAALQVRLNEVCDLVEESRQRILAARPPEQDDLTVIKGIGPAFQKRLYEAGIHRLKDLAESSPEKMSKLLGGSVGRKRDYGNWIERAKQIIEAEAAGR